jgi:hypothetical protein
MPPSSAGGREPATGEQRTFGPPGRRVESLVRLLYAGATAWLDRKKAVADDILGRSWPARKRRRPAYTPGGDAG